MALLLKFCASSDAGAGAHAAAGRHGGAKPTFAGECAWPESSSTAEANARQVLTPPLILRADLTWARPVLAVLYRNPLRSPGIENTWLDLPAL
jgi:hypothetical protein